MGSISISQRRAKFYLFQSHFKNNSFTDDIKNGTEKLNKDIIIPIMANFFCSLLSPIIPKIYAIILTK